MPVPTSPLAREVADFLDSMPAAYARAFTLRDAEEHARIVARRGGQLAHAEVGGGRATPAFVCVVADDRPGLLSLVTDAMLVHGLSVNRAQVYCRRRSDGQLEAVDFFWLEPSQASEIDGALEVSDLVSFAQTLRELIAEEQLVLQQPAARDTIPVPGPRPSRVYFDIDALRADEFVLIVHTPDFPGLLFAISSAMHAQGVRIVDSEIRTKDGMALDRFHVESTDARPLTAERLCDVQQSVHGAVIANSTKS